MQYTATRFGMASVYWTKQERVTWATPKLWWAVGKPEKELYGWLMRNGYMVEKVGRRSKPTEQHIKIITTLAALIPTLPARYSEVDKDADQ